MIMYTYTTLLVLACVLANGMAAAVPMQHDGGPVPAIAMTTESTCQPGEFFEAISRVCHSCVLLCGDPNSAAKLPGCSTCSTVKETPKTTPSCNDGMFYDVRMDTCLHCAKFCQDTTDANEKTIGCDQCGYKAENVSKEVADPVDSDPEVKEGRPNRLSTPALVGIVVGAVIVPAGVLLALTLVFVTKRRRKRPACPENSSSDKAPLRCDRHDHSLGSQATVTVPTEVVSNPPNHTDVKTRVSVNVPSGDEKNDGCTHAPIPDSRSPGKPFDKFQPNDKMQCATVK